ncbi:helix-turn-helix transcriptional regulator, partial [Rahnella sp. SL6]|uniref:helix-turn-helix domain-containing protein n=1 Tax=Rahnella perminowiae TaxID=2816244 RepID=UPI001C25B478
SLPINDQYIGVLSVARKEDIFVSQKESMNISGMITVYLHKLNNQFLRDFNNKLIDKVGNLTPPAILTARERECLVWLAEGKISWEISRILSISERTAVFHINNCMTKLGAKNRVQVIMKAMRANIIK